MPMWPVDNRPVLLAELHLRVTVDAAGIARLRSQGHSVREIAAELGYSRSIVHKTLANREWRRVAITTG